MRSESEAWASGYEHRELMIFVFFVFEFSKNFRFDVERGEGSRQTVEFTSRGLWRPVFEHSSLNFLNFESFS